MEGAEASPNLRVRMDNSGTVYARWAPQGMLIKIH